MKTVEELLTPRYKMIADYFYSPYKIGDIITVLYGSVHLTTTHYRDEFGETVDQANHFNPVRLKEFPHLFQPLPWWGDRKIEDLPEYVKHVNGGVFKVVEHCVVGASLEGKYYAVYKNLQPATREEYELFKQKEK